MNPANRSDPHSDLVSRLPAEYRHPLVCGDDAVEVPATMIADPGWMAAQMRLRCRIWGIDDMSVIATLWWYSASHFLLTPSIAALLVTGRVHSPALADLTLHHRPDSRVTGAQSHRVVETADPVGTLGGMLHEMLTGAIEIVRELSGRSAQSLWALVTDSLANRALYFGEGIGAVDRAGRLAVDLAAAIGPELPVPRLIDVGPPPATAPVRRIVHRQSCCLLYRVPGEQLCTSCPRRHPDLRRADLGTPR